MGKHTLIQLSMKIFQLYKYIRMNRLPDIAVIRTLKN